MSEKFLPDFFIIGAQKSGTSTLHHILENTNLVSLPKNKETHYFSEFIKKKKKYSWYEKQFFIKKSHELVGEVDPSYIYIDDSARNIKKIVKKPKIIIILRKPIDRAFSHYSMSYRRGIENFSFIEAILNEPQRLENKKEFNLKHFSYLDRGNYSSQIIKYQEIFKDSEFLFLKFDDLLNKKSKKKLIFSLFDFLGIKRSFIDENFNNIHMNKNKTFRFKWIQNILYNDSRFKSLLSKLIKNSDIKYRIKENIEKINLKNIDCSTDTIYKQLPQGIVDWNNAQIPELEKITDLNLEKWYIE